MTFPDDWDDDEFFKSHSHSSWHYWWSNGGGMDVVIGIACLFGIAILLALICRCCCGSTQRGRVLQRAPDPNSSVPAPHGAAPYPQQQYSTVTVTAVPAGHGTGAYPVSVSYPTAGAPYPGAGGPYPGAGAPYPTAGAPYPAVAPYPAAPYPAGPYPSGMPQPQPSTAPSAPDAHTLPPSYDQVMSNEAKHPPFNPYAPR